MVTRIEHFRCDICDLAYKTSQDAKACEDRGIAEPLPTGLVFASHRPNWLYNDITFAIARCAPDGHSRHAVMWACRDNGRGDSLGDERCGNGGDPRPEASIGELDPEHPTFKRMLLWLVENNITPTAYDKIDGEAKIVAIEDHSDQRYVDKLREVCTKDD